MRLTRALAAFAAAAVLLSACGDSGSGAGSASEGTSTPTSKPAAKAVPTSSSGSVLQGSAERLTGGSANLASYRGDVVLVVNTASECGFTPQFADLQELYASRSAKGFVILGFPSDSFNQELDDAQAIKDVCEKNFGVKFPMFARTSVTGDDAHPLFKRLARATGEEPAWNFNKYLVDRRGRVVGRFDSGDIPTREIDELLAQRS